MGAIEDEVGRMRLLVNDLLMLARLDEERPLEQRPVDLLAVAADAVRDAHCGYRPGSSCWGRSTTATTRSTR